MKRENKKELLKAILNTVNNNNKNKKVLNNNSDSQLKHNTRLDEIENLCETINDLNINRNSTDVAILNRNKPNTVSSNENSNIEGTNETSNDDDIEDVCDLLGGMSVGEIIHMFKKALFFKKVHYLYLCLRKWWFLSISTIFQS